MGSYDGAELCELVGSFRLSQLQKININIGLDRDDRLAISNTTPRDTVNNKKEICCIFNHNGLRITIEANKQTINFLDVTFNLNKNTYQPFTKSYTTHTIRPPREQPPTNHHKEHAPRHQQKTVIPFIRQSILRPSRSSIPKSIRLLRVPVHSTLRTNKRKNRQRNILWYNPPFSKNISTNIGHRFLALVD